MTPRTYERVVLVATGLLALIIFTGAAVRLTESGLGCEDWPTCNDDQVVPEASFHGWIEFGNRLLSGVVALAVAAAALSSYRRVPRRADLIRWAWGLVAGVVAQILLGAVTVKLDLHPLIVSCHFLLSAILMWNALVLLAKASGSPARPEPKVDPTVLTHSRFQVVGAAVVLILGTIVTGTGPNSGDIRADRLALDLQWTARAHSLAAWIFLLSLVMLALRLRTTTSKVDGRPVGVPSTLLAATLVQGGIGYWQYFTGVPALLVEFHVIGAVAVWCAAIWTHLGLFDRGSESSPPADLPVDHLSSVRAQ